MKKLNKLMFKAKLYAFPTAVVVIIASLINIHT